MGRTWVRGEGSEILGMLGPGIRDREQGLWRTVVCKPVGVVSRAESQGLGP